MGAIGRWVFPTKNGEASWSYEWQSNNPIKDAGKVFPGC